MRLRWLAFGLVALALGPLRPAPARAQTEVSSTAVLGLEAIDTPTSVTDEISEQLRQRVSASRDMRLVSGKDLIEVKLVFSCADEAASCMAQAGKSLDAQRLIYGSVKKMGDDYAVWLKMFDVRRARIEFWLTETLPKASADATGIKLVSGRWFAKLTGRPANVASLQVSANVTGAAVSLDGNPMGVTGERPLILGDVAPGKHELQLTKAGRLPARQSITVTAGQTLPLNMTLPESAESRAAAVVGKIDAKLASRDVPDKADSKSEATEPTTAPPAWTPSDRDLPERTHDGGRSGYRTGFWVTLAAGVVSATAALKFGLDVQDVNSRLDPYRRFPCMSNPSQVCDAAGVQRAPLTDDEKKKVASLNDEGNRAQTLQWICVGIGSALGIASGYLLYRGYIDSDDDRGAHQARRGLRIFPAAGASRGGILAEFDF